MMGYTKHLIIVLGGVFFVFVLFPTITHAENINSFHVLARIRADGGVSVSEGIEYNFGNLTRHGIFRTIPLTSKNGPRIVITPGPIHDENRQPYQYTNEGSAYSAKWKIGDPNSMVSGIKTYWINYDVSNDIRRFDDHDEWYWNVTGNEWDIPIDVSDIVVELPEGVSPESARATCFVGVSGSKENECTIESRTTEFHASSPRSLAPGEGMTIAVSMPPGSVTGYAVALPEPTQEIPTLFGDFGGFLDFLPIAIFGSIGIGIFSLFFSFIRRNKVKIVIPRKLKGMPVVVSYEPPEGLTPPDIGTLIDRSMDPRDMAPVLIDLAVKGYIKINYKGARSYEFIKVKSGADLKHPAYVRSYEVLFGKEGVVTGPPAKNVWRNFFASSSVSRESVTLSKLSRESTRIPGIFRSMKMEMAQRLKKQGYITKDSSVPIVHFSITIVMFLLFYIAFISSSVYMMVVVIIIFFLSFLIRAQENLSEKGIEAFKKILGFKEYLGMVEADKLRLLNAPELKPELFEKYLPFVMVFKLEKIWAKKFEAIPLVQPQWIEGSMASFSVVAFADSLSSMNSSFSSAFSSASSSGGDGGGGSSGGGSGGGGGGSW